MKNTIKNIVSEAVNQARMESSSYDRAMTLADVQAEIKCIVEFIKFDTVVAKNMFMGFVEAELQKVVPFLCPAKMQMDKNGNYTSNPKLWV